MTDVWFLLAHGAGAPSSSPWMRRWSEHLRHFGPVEPFDYPYMHAGRKRPDAQPKLLAAHREALEVGRARHGNRVILAGKSMGGRMGCHLALQEPVLGVLCLGYPLRGMGKAGKLRDQVLLELERPACFIQGTRDNLCPLDTLREVLERRNAPSELHVVETGNHSLEATKTHLKSAGLTQDELEARALETIERWLTSLG